MLTISSMCSSYLTVYRKVGGEWLIEVDIINIRKVYPQSDETATNEAGGSKRRLIDVLLRLVNDKTPTPGVLHRRGVNRNVNKSEILNLKRKFSNP